MTKIVVGIAALVAVFGTSAWAADMEVKAPPTPAAPIAPAFSWAGFYLGGTLGADLQSSTFNDPGKDISIYTPTFKNRDVTFEAGVTAGYNWQFQSIVLGVEGDWNWANFSKTGIGWTGTAPEQSTIQSKSDWFSTARGRIGWANDRMLVYFTGGAAFVNYSDAAQYTGYTPNIYVCGGSGGYWSCPSGTLTGYAVGGGLEAMLLQNISFKVEYLHLQMPSVGTFDPVNGFHFSWNYNADIIRLGANYHF
jgi:outer membrane immunogenic protein